MDQFTEALLGDGTSCIPKEYDWFAPLIGDWDFIYTDTYNGTPREVEGEWLFRRALEGTAIQDLFICPSRATKESNPQPDPDYGIAIRIFNPKEKCYDMTYLSARVSRKVRFIRKNEKLVGSVLDGSNEKWVFVQIAEDAFHWQNVTELKSGEWIINSNVHAKRK